MTALLQQLASLPDTWPLVAVDGNKRPYQSAWQQNPLTKDQVASEIRAGRARAVGLIAGPTSGLMMLDHDGISATQELERLGLPLSSLPPTVAMTSRRDGRFQLIYRVPEQYWPSLRGRRVFRTGKVDATGKAEQLELRWHGHQSVVIGHHPDTEGYIWCRGRSPSEQPIADAPTALIELLLDEPPAPPTQQPALPMPPPPTTDTVPFLDFISRSSRDLIESGGTPGAWNDDQLKLALDLRGTESWIIAQGHRPDITASEAFALHIAAAASKARDFDESKAWHRFNGAINHNPRPSTPDDKLRSRLQFHTKKEARRPQQAPSHDSPSPEPTPSGAYFTCLGFDQDAYYYQPASTGQVLRLGASSHTSTNLVRLAPLEYWETLYKGKKEDSVHWTKAASDLFIQQGAVGVYNPDRIRGRGAWRDANRTILHLGDRLIVDGITAGISKDIETTYLYQRLSRLKGPALDNPMQHEESFIVVDLASRFNWEVPASGILLAGWVALAPVCGALRWRPHAWLTAAAGSGKSAILDRFISPLLADMGLLVQGNTTEAGLRQKLRADAMPVVFDEAESNEKRDADRMQSVLALARVASSESQAGLFKGSAGGDAMRFSIRSMFMLSSISTALKQGADRSRFAQLTLRSPGDIPKDERIAHWEALDRDLDRYISHDFARRLQARTVANLPLILESIGVFIRVAARHFDSQRLGDQYGTLLAGAWSLTFDTVPTDEQAQRLIDENNWEPYSAATESPDEERCLQRILEHQIRCETERGTHTRTVSELVEVVTKKIGVGTITNEMAESILGRHGIRVDPEAGQLLISNSAMALAAILRDTAWAHGWGTVLGRLRGAIKTNPIRFRGISGAHRAVAVPLTTIDP